MSFELESIRSAMKDTAYERVIEEIRVFLKSTTELDKISKICLEKLVDASQSVGGTFWYYNRNLQTITAYAVYGGKDLSNIILKPNEGIAGKVIYTGKSVLVDNCKKDISWSNNTDSKTGFATESMICLPVEISGIIVGCVQLVNHRFNYGFEQKDLEFAEKFIKLVENEIESNKDVLNAVMIKLEQLNAGFFSNVIYAMFDMLKNNSMDEVLKEVEENKLFSSLKKLGKRRIKRHLVSISKILNRNN